MSGTAFAVFLQRLSEFGLPPCPVCQSASGLPLSSQPLFLLGERYTLRSEAGCQGEQENAAGGEVDEAEAAHLMASWLSLPRCTYRAAFPPLPGGLTSDAGWGCTLRSGQMLLARALSCLVLGREWRWTAPPSGEVDAGGAAHAQLMHLFQDEPGRPFGLHALCEAGAACGVTAGAWLGPHALCNALKAAAEAALGEHRLLVRVVSSGCGGAPTLCRDDVLQAATRAHGTPAPRIVLPVLPVADGNEGAQAPWTPVLLLVPLVLGLGRAVNPAYGPQLCAALAMPQSVGIVGGRPGTSLYFVGVQGDAVLYLDPHEVQPHVAHDAHGEAAPFPVESYHCATLRHMSLSGIDPSLALGFFAPSKADFDSLCDSLQAQAEGARAAPLLTVAARAAAEGGAQRREEGLSEGEGQDADEWQVL